MDNEKNLDFDESAEGREGEGDLDNAPRARNRTVMLTPEITGQVRARLAKELDPSAALADVAGAATAGGEGAKGGGFVAMAGRRPAAEPTFDARPRANTPPASPPSGSNRMGSPDMGARSAAPTPSYQAPTSRGAAPAATQANPDGDLMEWRKLSPIVGMLVTFDRDENGEVFPLRAGRLIVTSEMPSGGNFLFLQDESVSSMHAIVRIGDNGEIQVLDQLSENGTVIRKEGEDEIRLSGEKGMMQHGDEVQFGDRSFQVCLMAKPRKGE